MGGVGVGDEQQVRPAGGHGEAGVLTPGQARQAGRGVPEALRHAARRHFAVSGTD